MMIKPLTLGPITLHSNLVQGPLAGYSCAPFRLLTWRYGKPGFNTTEMISAKTLVHNPRFSRRRYTWKDPDEGPVCFQLSANSPLDLAEATKLVTDQGADLIDLNCGCPVNKIRTKGAGSKLLSNPSLLADLIKAMKDNTSVPVSIKIRVDGDSQESFNRDIINVVNNAGLDFLTVHGRHWTERYDTPCRLDQIAEFVNEVNIPVIGNGDAACTASTKALLDIGCAGVMIARESVGQPWLFEQIRAELEGQLFTPPSPHEIGLIFIEHVERLIELIQSEKFAILQSRKLGKYYARGLKNRADFIVDINHCSTFESLKTMVFKYFS